MDSRRFQQFFCLCSQRFSMTVSSSFVQCTTVIISALVSVVVPPQHSELCDIFSMFCVLIVLKRRRTFPCTRKYFSVFLTSCWRQINCMFPLKKNRLACWRRHTCDLLALTDFIFVHPAVQISAWKVFLFLFCFIFLLKTFLTSFRFVSLVFFNCMSKKGVCFIYSSFFFNFIFSSCKKRHGCTPSE